MTDLEKLKELLGAASRRYDPNKEDFLDHLIVINNFAIDVRRVLPALIAELEAARAVVEAAQAQRDALDNGLRFQATEGLRHALAHYQEVTK